MKKFLIFLFTFFLGIFLIGWVLKGIGWGEVKEAFANFSFFKILIILTLTVLIWLAGLWKWKFILNSKECRYSFFTLLQIAFASSAVTYLLTPTALLGGEGFKAYVLRKKFNTPWDKNIAALIIEKLLSLSILLFFLTAGFISFLLLSPQVTKNLLIVSLLLVGGMVIGLVVFYLKSFKKESMFKLVYRFLGKRFKNGNTLERVEEEVYTFFDFRKRVMWQGLFIALVRMSLIFLRCGVLVFFLQGEFKILVVLAVFFFLYLAYSLPLPAGIGSLEAIQAFAFTTLGYASANGFIFSFVLRGSEIIISLIGLIFFVKLTAEVCALKFKQFLNKISLLRDHEDK